LFIVVVARLLLERELVRTVGERVGRVLAPIHDALDFAIEF
jgi:hypothetical protein